MMWVITTEDAKRGKFYFKQWTWLSVVWTDKLNEACLFATKREAIEKGKTLGIKCGIERR